MLKFHRLDFAGVDWDRLDAFGDRIFSQRRHWLEFLAAFTHGEPVIAQLEDAEEVVGYFSGVRFHRCGVPILGSPFPGWTTLHMGFNLAPEVPRAEALECLEKFAFRDLGCLHLEVADRHLTIEDATRLKFAHRLVWSRLTDLSRDEDQLFMTMTSACRRAIRKSERSGLVVEQASPQDFAEEYYEHLEDVFAKQGLRPTYTCERVRKLIEHVHPSGDLLLARVRDPEGRSIATGIYPGYGPLSFFWGNGSLRRYQIMRPNEALHWFAMRYWKGRGIGYHDWGGAHGYKVKYGGVPSTTLALRKSRGKLLQYARDSAEKLYYFPRVLRRWHYDRRIGTS
jgi:Acetyltransferase (GNAT) domain